MHVLVLEDDAKLAALLRAELEEEGHEVEVLADGDAGLQRALAGGMDLLLLDLGLPGLDGLDVLRRLRAQHTTLPVIVITARDGVEDRVAGLDLGADDYLVKPFSLLELKARIRALFRRTEHPLERVLCVGSLRLDRIRRTASYGERSIELSPREFQLLEVLMESPGEPLPRALIAERVWGYALDGGMNVLEVYVNYLRKKLRAIGLEPIRTLRGLGYVLEPAACELSAP
ncbi:MAG: DNA-binding response regulator [Planctomycetota bacterium]|nr:MAG: DNA-binding response regulator [Planctomycetota bacterium]